LQVVGFYGTVVGICSNLSWNLSWLVQLLPETALVGILSELALVFSVGPVVKKVYFPFVEKFAEGFHGRCPPK
jgi:hypothetical protein